MFCQTPLPQFDESPHARGLAPVPSRDLRALYLDYTAAVLRDPQKSIEYTFLFLFLFDISASQRHQLVNTDSHFCLAQADQTANVSKCEGIDSCAK
jgi:hypothetical protein